MSSSPSTLIKNYYSELTKDTYTIREKISSNMKKLFPLLSNNQDTLQVLENDYYLTDGIFCSFNCCLAFIKSKWYNKIYSESEVFLNQIYYSLFDKTMKIMKAPSWRLLQVYGGLLSIEEFRYEI